MAKKSDYHRASELAREKGRILQIPEIQEHVSCGRNQAAEIRQNLIRYHPKLEIFHPREFKKMAEFDAKKKETGRKIRKCLTCGSFFDSEWIGNRICHSCKNHSGYQSSHWINI